MNERLRNAFNGITPISCDRELYETTLKKAAAIREAGGNKRPRVSKPFAALCSAVIVLVIGTVSIGAAYYRGLGMVLSPWLGNQDKLHEVMSEVSTANVKSSFENLDINVCGGLTDGTINIVFLDITRTDGGAFDMSDQKIEFKDGNIFNEKCVSPKAAFDKLICVHEMELVDENVYSNRIVYAQQYFIEDDDPVDDKLTIAIAWIKNKDSHSEGVEISVSDLMLTKTAVDYEYFENTDIKSDQPYEKFSGSYSAAINMDKIAAKVKTLSTNEIIKLNFNNYDIADMTRNYDIDFTLDSISVSPMTVSFKAHREKIDEFQYMTLYESIGYVTLKDGSSIAIASINDKPCFNNQTGNGGHAVGGAVYEAPVLYERWNIDCSFMLEEAVKLDDVVSVTIGETTIDLADASK